MQGTISEDQADSFDLPLHPVSPSEISKLVNENGCFRIEKMELINIQISLQWSGPVNGEDVSRHLRAGLEGLIRANILVVRLSMNYSVVS